MISLSGNNFYPGVFNGPTNSSFTIDAAGEKVAFGFRVPKTGNIDRISLVVATVTSSQTIRGGLETVDASGDPTGTQYGGSAVGTQASPAAQTAYEITLATPASATIGDRIAAVFQFDSSVGNLSIYGSQQYILPINTSYIDQYTTSWAHITNSLPVLSIRYDDGIYYNIGVMPAAVPTAVTFNSGSTPDERGNKITIPYAIRAIGMWYVLDQDNACDIVLYDSDGTTALETVAVSSIYRGATTTQLGFAYFPERILKKNGVVYVAIKPGASNVATQTLAALSAGHWAAFTGGTNIVGVSRTNAGSWTEDAALRHPCGLIFNGIKVGSNFAYIT